MENNTKLIKFKAESRYNGKGQWCKMIGLNIYASEFLDHISIFPQNSRNTPGSAEMEIPKNAISEIIRELNKYNPEPLLLDETMIEFTGKIHQTQCNNCGKRGFIEPLGFRRVKCEFCHSEHDIA